MHAMLLLVGIFDVAIFIEFHHTQVDKKVKARLNAYNFWTVFGGQSQFPIVSH